MAAAYPPTLTTVFRKGNLVTIAKSQVRGQQAYLGDGGEFLTAGKMLRTSVFLSWEGSRCDYGPGYRWAGSVGLQVSVSCALLVRRLRSKALAHVLFTWGGGVARTPRRRLVLTLRSRNLEKTLGLQLSCGLDD